MKVFQNKNSWIIEDYLDNDFLEEIKNIIEVNLNNLYKNKEGYSTTGKNAEQYWIVDQETNFSVSDSRFYKIEEEYKNQVCNRIIAADLLEKRLEEHINLMTCSAWTVIGEENSYHTMHDHGRVYDGISTLVYLEVPETNVEDEPENDIFFSTHVGPRNQYYYENASVININPEVGKLLIFPNWVPHGTYPQTKGIRQSFNVDYKLVADEKNSLKKFSYN
tara:strand:- start:80 stop:739 length:660 start_codon:yes stop_codon:yes gene_type:complete